MTAGKSEKAVSEKVFTTPLGGAFQVFRGRLSAAVTLATALCVFVVAGVFTLTSYREGYSDLNGNLNQSVTAFHHTMVRNLEWLSDQGELIASDPRVSQYREALALAEPESEEAKELQAVLQEHLKHVLAGIDGDAILLIGANDEVTSFAVREIAKAGEESRLENSETDSKSSGVDSVIAPTLGQKMRLPMMDAVYKYSDTRVGFCRLNEGGPLFAVATIPCFKGKSIDGVLVLANAVSIELLSDWSRGGVDGILAVVSDKKVLVAYDKRSARRPSPVLLESLEVMASSWIPPVTAESGLERTDVPFTPSDVTITGCQWRALPVVLDSGEGSKPSGWVLFLADTSDLSLTTSRAVWVFGFALAILLPLVFGIFWKVSPWLAAAYHQLSAANNQNKTGE